MYVVAESRHDTSANTMVSRARPWRIRGEGPLPGRAIRSPFRPEETGLDWKCCGSGAGTGQPPSARTAVGDRIFAASAPRVQGVSRTKRSPPKAIIRLQSRPN